MQTTWRSLCGQLLKITPQTNIMITKIQGKSVVIRDLVIDGVDPKDYPDFVDAFISSATIDGREAQQDELDALSEDYELVYMSAIDSVLV
jgi:hypothetical protein